MDVSPSPIFRERRQEFPSFCKANRSRRRRTRRGDPPYDICAISVGLGIGARAPNTPSAPYKSKRAIKSYGKTVGSEAAFEQRPMGSHAEANNGCSRITDQKGRPISSLSMTQRRRFRRDQTTSIRPSNARIPKARCNHFKRALNAEFAAARFRVARRRDAENERVSNRGPIRLPSDRAPQRRAASRNTFPVRGRHRPYSCSIRERRS